MNMNDHKTALILLFMLSFALSSLPSSSSRSLKNSITEENIYSSTQFLYDEFQRKDRMDFEIADYSGTGANNHHDPKTPPGN